MSENEPDSTTAENEVHALTFDIDVPEAEEPVLIGDTPKQKKVKKPVIITVTRKDSWDSLIEKYGPEILEKNNKTKHKPLIVGMKLTV